MEPIGREAAVQMDSDGGGLNTHTGPVDRGTGQRTRPAAQRGSAIGSTTPFHVVFYALLQF